jgi:hypothetical protein
LTEKLPSDRDGRTEDLRRDRWRTYRRALGVVADASEFAMGGLAQRVRDPQFRLVVLPEDPHRDLITFDDEFWGVWMEDRAPPFSTRFDWGHEKSPSANAAIRGEKSDGQWTRILAAHRHGGVEVIGSYSWVVEDVRFYALTSIVATIWTALDVQTRLAAKYGVGGPWEVTVSLRDTEGAHLGDLGEGWREPMMGGRDLSTCPDEAVLVSAQLGAKIDPQAAAFDLGGRIEDAWGFQERRFIARAGDSEGLLDVRQVRPR